MRPRRVRPPALPAAPAGGPDRPSLAPPPAVAAPSVAPAAALSTPGAPPSVAVPPTASLAFTRPRRCSSSAVVGAPLSVVVHLSYGTSGLMERRALRAVEPYGTS